MDGSDIPPLIKLLLPPLNPLDAGEILYYLDRMRPVSKSQDCTAALFGAGMETIHDRFSLEAWIHTFIQMAQRLRWMV